MVRLLRYLEEKIQRLFSYPEMHGASPKEVELQFYLLLEIRGFILTGNRSIQQEISDFALNRLGKKTPLSDTEPPIDFPELIGLLKDFLEYHKQKMFD